MPRGHVDPNGKGDHAMESYTEWSRAEKKIARRAFDAALEKALSAAVADFKARAATVSTPSEMWGDRGRSTPAVWGDRPDIRLPLLATNLGIRRVDP
jgi:hypothetical protein